MPTLHDPAAPEKITSRITALADWRGETLAHLRGLIRQTLPDVVEDWKWRGVPVWYQNGMICTGETCKTVVKLTFAKGAALPDPGSLFNASLDGTTRRAIDLHQGKKIDAAAFQALLRAAAALNAGQVGPKTAPRST